MMAGDGRESRLRALLAAHPALTFIVATYVITWSFWIPGVLLFRAQPTPAITPGPLALALLGTYGPTFAALLMVAVTRGRPGLHEFLNRYLRRRVGIRWHLLAVFIPVVVFSCALGAKALGGANLPSPAWDKLTLAAFLGRLVFALPFGPLGEEGGWRGYLLPSLEAKYSALTSGVVVGAVWTLWHLPMFWVPGAALPPTVAPSVAAAIVYMLGVIPTSIIATALYNSTGGSLFIAVVYHLSTNFWHPVLAPAFIGDSGAAWA